MFQIQCFKNILQHTVPPYSRDVPLYYSEGCMLVEDTDVQVVILGASVNVVFAGALFTGLCWVRI